jgi:hypothetical protein
MSRILPASRIVRVSWMSAAEDSDIPEGWLWLSPLVKFAVLPLGLLLKRSLAPRLRVLGALLRWGPPVLGAVRSVTGARERSDHG